MEHNVIVISSYREIGEKGFFFPATRVTVPEFEIYSNPTIVLSEIKQRRFSLWNRNPDGT